MLTIIDYGVGNLASIQNMLKKAGAKSLISSNVNDVANATKIIMPGMGHFDNCMIKLNQSGLMETLQLKANTEKIPMLGICVGLQMLMESSEEGVEQGLGWVKGKTVKFKKELLPANYTIPNMGWLDVKAVKKFPLFENLEYSRFYFAHSFYVQPENEDVSLLKAFYGYEYTVAIQQENIMGIQFHPEKSHRFGMQLLKNFAFNF